MRLLYEIAASLAVLGAANAYWVFDAVGGWGIAALALLFLFVNLFPAGLRPCAPTRRLRVCETGCALLRIFLLSAAPAAIGHVAAAFALIPARWGDWLFGALVALAVESAVFWNGIARVYGASVQLGVKLRVIGILCGWVPVANLWALGVIIKTVSREVAFESEKQRLDAARAGEKICGTRYPLLLVHGVFFRDRRFPNYWGRIPAALEQNGARVFYGNHESAASVADSARELTARIREIAETTSCGKVNVVAHSKGGLDIRYAVSCCGAAPLVASVTTVNTPHRGCVFADALLEKIPARVQRSIADKYNAAMRKLGDKRPDFLAAVRDLTARGCAALGPEMPDAPGVLYRSVGSRLNGAAGGKFPLNLSYPLVRRYDGANDGLVSLESFPWGEDYTLLTVNGKRGVSHADVIDLNRENIPGFDVREFYVQLVANLKRRGL